MHYDAIIVGASFAGLSAAAQLRGKRVLLIDRKPIGTGQTSACGTILEVLESLDALDAVLQVHDKIVVHVAGRRIDYPLAYPFCTFDYERLCRILEERNDAEFLLARALGLDRDAVVTIDRTFRAVCLIDASGWRAVLAGPNSNLPSGERMSFGIETVREYREDGLHFWYDPDWLIPKGVTWLFPCGGFSRIGAGSYVGDTKLRYHLGAFLERFDLSPDGLHGGYFPHALRRGTTGHVFLAGDAAGQCLGVTGEGIRTALYFGQAAGRTVRRVLDGQLSLDEGLAEYSRFVERHRIFYQTLLVIQQTLVNLPVPVVKAIIGIIHWPPILRSVMRAYKRAFDPARLAVSKDYEPSNALGEWQGVCDA
ncbi:MAG: NAD(P)/FAD-dependent oxidoreductase [Chloroflexota bacterium]